MIKIGETLEHVPLTILEDGYYYVNEAQCAGFSCQRVIIKVDQPYAFFHGINSAELTDSIFGTFTEILETD